MVKHVLELLTRYEQLQAAAKLESAIAEAAPLSNGMLVPRPKTAAPGPLLHLSSHATPLVHTASGMGIASTTGGASTAPGSMPLPSFRKVLVAHYPHAGDARPSRPIEIR